MVAPFLKAQSDVWDEFSATTRIRPGGRGLFMWDRITAIGTLILIVLTVVLISQGAALTWLHWPWFMLPVGIVGGLVVAAVLNFLTAFRKRDGAAAEKADVPRPRLERALRQQGIYKESI